MKNVKTSPPKENKNIDDDVFVLIKKCILKGVFGFGTIEFVVISNYTFSNAFELKNKVTFFTYFLKVGISFELQF